MYVGGVAEDRLWEQVVGVGRFSGLGLLPELAQGVGQVIDLTYYNMLY